MPYIRPEEREWIAKDGLAKLEDTISHANGGSWTGLANYIVTRIMLAFIGPEVRYAQLNAAIGVLECVRLELYRRVAAGYEDEKARENGDVYPRAKCPPECCGADVVIDGVHGRCHLKSGHDFGHLCA